MTEQEFIDATNVARIRAVNAILRDVLLLASDLESDEEDLSSARTTLARLEDKLSARIEMSVKVN